MTEHTERRGHHSAQGLLLTPPLAQPPEPHPSKPAWIHLLNAHAMPPCQSEAVKKARLVISLSKPCCTLEEMGTKNFGVA